MGQYKTCARRIYICKSLWLNNPRSKGTIKQFPTLLQELQHAAHKLFPDCCISAGCDCGICSSILQHSSVYSQKNLPQKMRLKIFYCNQNITIHTNSPIAVADKDTNSKNMRNRSQFVSQRTFTCRKRSSSWMVGISTPCWQRLVTVGKKGQAFLPFFFFQLSAQN